MRLNVQKFPSVTTFMKLKRMMRFDVTSVAIHPELNSTMMKELLINAQINVKADWSHIVVIYEKWFTEETLGNPVLELSRGHAWCSRDWSSGATAWVPSPRMKSRRLSPIAIVKARLTCAHPFS